MGQSMAGFPDPSVETQYKICVSHTSNFKCGLYTDTSCMCTKMEQIRTLIIDNVTLSEKEDTNKQKGVARTNPMA